MEVSNIFLLHLYSHCLFSPSHAPPPRPPFPPSRNKNDVALRVTELVTQLWLVEELTPHLIRIASENDQVKDVLNMIKKQLADREIIQGLPSHILMLEGTNLRGVDGEYFWRGNSENGWFEKRSGAGPRVVIIKEFHPASVWQITLFSQNNLEEEEILYSAPVSNDNALESKFYPPEVGWTAAADLNPFGSPRVTIHKIGTAIAPFPGKDIDSSDDGGDASSNRAEGDDDMDMYDDIEWPLEK